MTPAIGVSLAPPLLFITALLGKLALALRRLSVLTGALLARRESCEPIRRSSDEMMSH